MIRLTLLQNFFNGAFEAFNQTNSVEDSMLKAWALVIEKYSKQPIYRSTLAEFTEWYQSIKN